MIWKIYRKYFVLMEMEEISNYNDNPVIFNDLYGLESFDTAIIADKAVKWHILDLSVSVDDISDRSLLDFGHHFSRVGVLVPKSVTISDTLELLASNGGSQLSEHWSRELYLSKHSHISVNVVDTVETFLNDESI